MNVCCWPLWNNRWSNAATSRSRASLYTWRYVNITHLTQNRCVFCPWTVLIFYLWWVMGILSLCNSGSKRHYSLCVPLSRSHFLLLLLQFLVEFQVGPLQCWALIVVKKKNKRLSIAISQVDCGQETWPNDFDNWMFNRKFAAIIDLQTWSIRI